MKEQTTDKIIRKLDNIFLYVQVVFSWYVILFGYGYALRALFTHYDRFFDKIFYAVCFALIGFVGHKFMLRTSLDELRKSKKGNAYE